MTGHLSLKRDGLVASSCRIYSHLGKFVLVFYSPTVNKLPGCFPLSSSLSLGLLHYLSYSRCSLGCIRFVQKETNIFANEKYMYSSTFNSVLSIFCNLLAVEVFSLRTVKMLEGSQLVRRSELKVVDETKFQALFIQLLAVVWLNIIEN